MCFSYTSTPVVAAVLVLSRHIKSSASTSRLVSPPKTQIVTSNVLIAQTIKGPIYEYVDTVSCVFVTSGRVGGLGFVEGGYDHVKGSKEKRSSAMFYILYPSKELSRSNSKRKGDCKLLIQVVAAGCDPKSEHVENLDKYYNNGGVIILSKEEERLIKSSMKNLKCLSKVKFKHMLAYLMEMGYKLALAPGDVASANPGFESVLGFLTRQQTGVTRKKHKDVLLR